MNPPRERRLKLLGGFNRRSRDVAMNNLLLFPALKGQATFIWPLTRQGA